MTEEAQDYFEFYDSIEIVETHLTRKLATLRQKLNQKAKQEKRTGQSIISFGGD